MKRVLTITLTVSLLTSASIIAFAQTTNSVVPTVTVTNHMSANSVISTNRIHHANHRNILQIIGIQPKDLQKLAPAQRQVKIKEAIDKRFAELEKKKAAGNLTPEETSDLALLTRYKKHLHSSSRTNSVSHVVPTPTNAPAAKSEK